MNRFFYTFGSSRDFPYQYGWVEVRAGSWQESHQKFRARFPDRHAGTLNCAFFYDEAQWTSLSPETNWTGCKCHEIVE